MYLSQQRIQSPQACYEQNQARIVDFHPYNQMPNQMSMVPIGYVSQVFSSSQSVPYSYKPQNLDSTKFSAPDPAKAPHKSLKYIPPQGSDDDLSDEDNNKPLATNV